MSSPSLESSLVRILIDDQEPRRPEGAGFLVTPKHILTCAHVVNAVLGRDEYTIDPPDAEIFLDFPLLDDQPLLRATILHWFPVSEGPPPDRLEDIAVLELCPETPLPVEAQPAPLVALDSSPSFTEHQLRMCGFPGGVDQGTHIDGLLKGRTGAGYWEIHPLDKTRPIEQGFSGTSVWAVKENAVCGMISSRLRRKPDLENGPVITGYMLPVATLIKAFPELDQHSRPANPYRGLEAFREKDAALYFGREHTIERLRQVVREQPFATVIGASGSGKSSVVFAGLVPALRQTGNWLIAHCRPKKEPFYELAACLIPLLYDDPILRLEKTDELKEKLQAGSVGLLGIIRQITERREQHESQRFLLIVDQFEELFTLNTDQNLTRQYIAILLECLRMDEDDFTVLFTMRADFFAAAVSHPALAQALDSYAPIILPQLDEQNLREVIERPAKSLGIRFEAGLIDLIIRDVGQEPGSLPLLEFCLTQLWERQEFRRITHDAYKDIGGVQQALANHADAVYAEFDEQEREQLRHIFLKLVRPGQGTEDTRQVASLEQIRAEDRTLITRLADKRLIVTGRDEEREEETVEVVHEALIRRWQTLRQWVDEEREFLVWQEKLRVLLRQWKESGKDEGALLRGLPLDEALRWRETHAVHLVDEELGFIKASEEAQRKQRRKKGIAVVAGMLLAAMVMVTFFVLWKDAERQKTVAEQERQHAVEQSKIAEQNAVEAKQQTRAANFNLAKIFEEKALRDLKTVEEKNDNRAYKEAVLFTSAALDQVIEEDKSALNPRSTARLFSPEVFNRSLAEEWRSPVADIHYGDVNSISLSPDGSLLASASSRTIQIWDIESGQRLIVLKGHTESITSVSFSSDGKQLASSSYDNTVRLWDIESGQEIKQIMGHKGRVNSVSISSDGRRLASASWDKTIRIWEIESCKELKVIRGHTNNVTSISFNSDGRRLASASSDKTVWIWNVESGQKLAIFKGHTDGVTSVSFSSDGRRLASASRDKTIRIWDVESGQKLAIFKGHTDGVTSVSFSSDGRRLASASSDKTIRIWDVEGGEELTLLKGHTGGINSALFHPDDIHLISSSRDNTVRIWNTKNGEELTEFQGHTQDVVSVSFSPNGKQLASASRDNTVRIWDVESGQELTVLKGYAECVSFSPDGRLLASASNDNTVRIWNIKSGKELTALKGHTASVSSVSFSPDGTRLASASSDNTARIWDIESGNELATFKGHTETVSSILNGVTSVSFSPDGKLLASGGKDNTVRIWDVESGKQTVLRGHTYDVNSISFSPNGKLLASASGDKTIRLWDVETGKNLIVIRAPELITSVSFSPDGRRLASASADKTIQIWDIKNGRQLKILKGHTGWVESVAFSPDGKQLASASWDNTVRLWNMVDADKKIIILGGGKGRQNFDVNAVYFSSDGRRVASGYIDGTVRFWDIGKTQKSIVFRGHTSAVTSVSLSPNGRWLASASMDDTVRIWNVESKQELIRLEDDSSSVSFNPEGTLLAFSSADNTIRLWNLENGQELRVFKGHTYSVNSVTFSPDGTQLASASKDKTIRLWNVENGQQLKLFKGHTDSVNNIVFSPDGKLLLSGSEDKTVRLWNIESGKEFNILKGHANAVLSVSFSPDGKLLASASRDNSVSLWDTETGNELMCLDQYPHTVHSVSFSADGKKVASAFWAPFSSKINIKILDIRAYLLFQQGTKPTPLYKNFIQGVKFLWQAKRDGLNFVPNYDYSKPSLYAQDGYNFVYDPKFRPLLNPPPPGQSKFDQVLEWAEKQQGK